MSRYMIALALLTFSALFSQSARASEWGCEVLLCSASSDPSWHGVSECHPPMEKLISAMKNPGFSWPTCPEGGAGKPGYEAYADCPLGTSPAISPSNVGNHGASGEKSQCVRTITSCKASSFADRYDKNGLPINTGGATRVYRNENSCVYEEYTARPRRSEPYFFDIQDEETKSSTRHYFDLNL